MNSDRYPHVFVIVAGYVLGLVLYPTFPGSGEDLLRFGPPMVALLLPTAAAVTYFLLRGLCVRHPIDAENSPNAIATFDAVMLRFISFLIAVHAIMLVGLQGVLRGRPWAGQIVPVLLGLTMIAIGNLLPRTRPNLAIGIRTSRTLADRALWMHTHRIAGYTLVALGLVIVVAGIAVPAPVGPAMILLVAPAAALGIPALVFCSKRHARV
jgi:uncharacterized membrane protein